jgi:hypothetical protein
MALTNVSGSNALATMPTGNGQPAKAPVTVGYSAMSSSVITRALVLV